MRCWECETVEMRTKVGVTCTLDRQEIWGMSWHSYREPHHLLRHCLVWTSCVGLMSGVRLERPFQETWQFSPNFKHVLEEWKWHRTWLWFWKEYPWNLRLSLSMYTLFLHQSFSGSHQNKYPAHEWHKCLKKFQKKKSLQLFFNLHYH